MGELNWKGKLKNEIAGVKELFHRHTPEEKALIKDYGHSARKNIGVAREVGILKSVIEKKEKMAEKMRAKKRAEHSGLKVKRTGYKAGDMTYLGK